MEQHIDQLQRLAAARPSVIALGGGLPSPSLFPRTRLSRAFVEAMREPSASALQYQWPEGRERLREWIAARVRSRGADVNAADVLVTSGAQQAIAIAAQLLVEPGDPVGVDYESYPAALDLLRTRGARPSSDTTRVACFYAMPAIGNPHSRPLSSRDRQALIAADAPIIEDDAYAELRFDGHVARPLLADYRERIWHVGTFSKTLCPGLRVGWLIPPRAMFEQALTIKHASDLQSSSLGQTILELFLSEDDFDARLNTARRFYRRHADRLVRAVRKRLPQWHHDEPQGGFALFLRADESGDDTELLEVATEHGVSFDPGRIFRPEDQSQPLALRLCFSAATGAQLDEGVRRLARAWDAYRRRRDRRVSLIDEHSSIAARASLADGDRARAPGLEQRAGQRGR